MLQKAGNLESNLEKSKTFRNEMFKIWKFEIRLEMQLKAGKAEIINFQKNLWKDMEKSMRKNIYVHIFLIYILICHDQTIKNLFVNF